MRFEYLLLEGVVGEETSLGPIFLLIRIADSSNLPCSSSLWNSSNIKSIDVTDYYVMAKYKQR